MSKIQTKSITNQWVIATWDEYIQAIDNLTYETTRGYYCNRQIQIEMTPL